MNLWYKIKCLLNLHTLNESYVATLEPFESKTKHEIKHVCVKCGKQWIKPRYKH